MPRVPPLYSDFFFEPLTEDVEELLARFQQMDSVRFEVFSAVWREMGLSDVFVGIAGMSEMKRFCRVALATAMKYFLPPYSYQIRVGGLYLMFAFYHTQLAVPPVNIRLALKDWGPVQKFLRDSVDGGHHDVVYVYRRLVAARAVHHAAMPHFLIFQKQRKPKREPVCAEFLGRTTAAQDLVSADLLEEVAGIQSQYEKLKEATAEVGRGVAMIQPGLVSHLRDCVSGFVAWQQKTFSNQDANPGGAKEKPSSSRARLLSSIKDKSYSMVQEAPKARRHRQTEVADSTSSGAEQVQQTAAPQKKRPPSLRARTRRSLGVMGGERQLQAWLLSAPEQQERVPVRRTNQTAPYRP